MSNFTFLQGDWPHLFEPPREAEQNVNSAPRTSCFCTRRTLERAVKWLYGIAQARCNACLFQPIQGLAMKKQILIIMLAYGICGCATQPMQGDSAYRTAQEWKLSRARALLHEGNRSAAVQVLTHICAEPVVPGVTDEALFRLSLLHIQSGRDAGSMVKAQQGLELLAKNYTFSSWAPLASSLARFLASAEEERLQKNKLGELNRSLSKEMGKAKEHNRSLNKEIGKVKEHNRSLSNENKELREGIEKLKALDKELAKEIWK